MTLLRVEGLETAYGDSQVLFGLSLEVNKGEVVALLGRNGAGRTTMNATLASAGSSSSATSSVTQAASRVLGVQ